MGESPVKNIEELGRSPGGLPIELIQLTSSQSGPELLLLGGVHGDERQALYLVEEFVKRGSWRELQGVANLWVVPRVNPDGCKAETRLNGRGVDLNRNLPTKDWDPVAHKDRYQPGESAGSEIENQILVQVIERIKPRLIVSAHCYEPMINYNGPCKKAAEVMSEATGYRIDDDIGYPTPGSLGTWAGWERKIPTITLEVQKDLDLDSTWKIHHDGLMAVFHFAALNENLGE